MSKANFSVIAIQGGQDGLRVEINCSSLDEMISALQHVIDELKERSEEKRKAALQEQNRAWRMLLDKQKTEINTNKGFPSRGKELL